MRIKILAVMGCVGLGAMLFSFSGRTPTPAIGKHLTFVDHRRLPPEPDNGSAGSNPTGVSASRQKFDEVRRTQEARMRQAAVEAEKLAAQKRAADDDVAKRKADEQQLARETETKRIAAAAEAEKLAAQRRAADDVAVKRKADEQHLARAAEVRRTASVVESRRTAEQQLAITDFEAKRDSVEPRLAEGQPQLGRQFSSLPISQVPAAVLALAKMKSAQALPNNSDQAAAAKAAALATARNKAEAERSIRCMAASNPSAVGC